MIKRNQMHRELLRLLIEKPAADDAELASVCQRYNEGAKVDDHISWARRWLKTCIDVYERRMSEPPSPIATAALATVWAIAKNPDLKGKQLLDWVLPRLKRKVRAERVTKDYGPQMRDRLAAIAQLSVERRTEILAALCRRLG